MAKTHENDVVGIPLARSTIARLLRDLYFSLRICR